MQLDWKDKKYLLRLDYGRSTNAPLTLTTNYLYDAKKENFKALHAPRLHLKLELAADRHHYDIGKRDKDSAESEKIDGQYYSDKILAPD